MFMSGKIKAEFFDEKVQTILAHKGYDAQTKIVVSADWLKNAEGSNST